MAQCPAISIQGAGTSVRRAPLDSSARITPVVSRRLTANVRPYFPTAFLFLVLLMPMATFAQQNFQWRNFTRIGDNLTSNNVRSIAEDRFGQIWLGTDMGVSRFGGFWHEVRLPGEGPQRNDVFQIFEDVEGFMWVATNVGVYRGIWDDSLNQISWVQRIVL